MKRNSMKQYSVPWLQQRCSFGYLANNRKIIMPASFLLLWPRRMWPWILCVCSCVSSTGVWLSSTTLARSTTSGWPPATSKDPSSWWTTRYGTRTPSLGHTLSDPSPAAEHRHRTQGVTNPASSATLCINDRCTTTVWTCGAWAACWPAWSSGRSPSSMGMTTTTRYESEDLTLSQSSASVLEDLFYVERRDCGVQDLGRCGPHRRSSLCACVLRIREGQILGRD